MKESSVKNLRQRPQGIYSLIVHVSVSFPQAKRVGNPSGKIPDKPEWQKFGTVVETIGYILAPKFKKKGLFSEALPA